MSYTYIPDLAARVDELVAEGPPTEHIQGRALFTNDRVKMLAFPLRAGQTFEEHTSPHAAMLHFVEGEAEVTLGRDAVEARAGTWIHLPPRLPHSIHAKTQSLMVLIVLRGAAPQ